MKNFKGLVIAALGISLFTGCKSNPGPAFDARQPVDTNAPVVKVTEMTSVPSTLDGRWLEMPTNSFTLGPGDKLEIQIPGDITTKSTTIVGPDGKIYYYLLPGVDVWGLTLSEAKTKLEGQLKEFFREQPQVSLTLRGVESKRFWMMGRVNGPGIYSLAMPVTLLEALTRAGGPSVPSPLASLASLGGAGTGTSSSRQESADLKRSFVIRDGKMLPVNFQKLLREGDMSQNIYLQADDFVFLPAAASQDIHVLGAVAQPRAVTFTDEVTLISAISSSGGSIKNAYLSHVAIVRGSLTEPKIAIVNYWDIVKGKAPDVRLEAQDIVYVPYTPYRHLTRYLDLIVNTFVRTVGANEGARAVSDGETQVDVNVPINF
ncbi:MAG TPA: polysaccharide biosynthesis/export family protein [Verrucomicrobiae bacterium]